MFVGAAECGNIAIINMMDAQGFDVNCRHPESGLTAMHVACAKGNRQLVRHLFKLRADWTIADELGQNALHKAVCHSVLITQFLLELAFPAKDEAMAEEVAVKRAQCYAMKDSDGKDCMLVAALAGQSEVVTEIQDATATGTREVQGEVGWTPNDVNRVIVLAIKGNIQCLKLVLDSGFDPSWSQEETGMTVAIISSLVGQRAVLDLLLERKVSFDQVDSAGRTALHYAAASRDAGGILSHILMHPKANECKITQNSIAMRDKQGRSVLYTAAASGGGGGMRLDLIAAEGMAAAMEMSDDLGMTPLMVAVRGMREAEVKYLLKQGAKAEAADKLGRNSLWHLFHRKEDCGPKLPLNISVVKFPGFPNVPALAPYVEHLDEEASRTLELDLALTLLRSGCSLYSVAETALSSKDEPPDVAATQGNTAFFKELPELISSHSCWLAGRKGIKFQILYEKYQ